MTKSDIQVRHTAALHVAILFAIKRQFMVAVRLTVKVRKY